MELIPILSAIILVATISTFILAIGAYIVFKVQERRADKLVQREEKLEMAEALESAAIDDSKLAVNQADSTQLVEHKQKPLIASEVKSEKSKSDLQSKQIKDDQKPAGAKYMKYNSSGYTKIDDDRRIITWR